MDFAHRSRGPTHVTGFFVGVGCNSEEYIRIIKVLVTDRDVRHPIRKEEVMNKAIQVKGAYKKLSRSVRRLWKGRFFSTESQKSAKVAADRVALMARRTRYLLPPPLKK